MTFRTSVIVPMLLLPLATSLATERQHGSHEHGTARLDVAIDDVELHIQLDSPAANLIGFEHPPRTREEKDILRRALGMLEAGGELFVINDDALCELTESDIDSPFSDDHDSHGHDEHHHEHDHGHGGHEATHADIRVTWHFNCERNQQIDTIDVRLFASFPGMHRIKVQTITSEGQGGTMLTPSRTSIDF